MAIKLSISNEPSILERIPYIEFETDKTNVKTLNLFHDIQ